MFISLKKMTSLFALSLSHWLLAAARSNPLPIRASFSATRAAVGTVIIDPAAVVRTRPPAAVKAAVSITPMKGAGALVVVIRHRAERVKQIKPINFMIKLLVCRTVGLLLTL